MLAVGMYRAEDTREVSINTDGVKDSIWLTLEPEILSNVAKRLCKRDAGSMRLACRTWQQSISCGVHSMVIVSLAKFISTYDLCKTHKLRGYSQ